MTKQPPRIQVKETQRYWGDLDGPLDGLIRELQSLLNEGWEGIVMEYDQWSQDPPRSLSLQAPPRNRQGV